MARGDRAGRPGRAGVRPRCRDRALHAAGRARLARTRLTIRTGIGGWTFAPWRGTFYPPGLPQARELAYAAGKLGAIEINGTFYRRQTPATFASWAKAAPDGFIFTLKGGRFCTNRRVLAEAGEAVRNFVAQGIVELGEKLGPILWQFADRKIFDPDDIRAFLALLPRDEAGVPLRHAVEPRHESFRCQEFVALARAADVGIVLGHADKYPLIADQSGTFTYLRLQGCREEVATGYSDAELDLWARRARIWSRGDVAPDVPLAADPLTPAPRDVFAFFISGAKVRAPAAALALAERLRLG